MIILLVVARVQPAEGGLSQFENYGGWRTMGLSLMIGQILSVYVAVCASICAPRSDKADY